MLEHFNVPPFIQEASIGATDSNLIKALPPNFDISVTIDVFKSVNSGVGELFSSLTLSSSLSSDNSPSPNRLETDGGRKIES